jgi:hypothetical protein
MTKVALSEELSFYSDIKEKLLEESRGKYVLIKGKRVAGIFDSEKSAYEKGLEKFGDIPFLIKKVADESCVESIPALTLGVFYVDS